MQGQNTHHMPKESKKGTRLAKRSTPFTKKAKPVTKGKPVAKPHNKTHNKTPTGGLYYWEGLQKICKHPPREGMPPEEGKNCPPRPQKKKEEKSPRICTYGDRLGDGKCPKPTIKKLNEEISKLKKQVNECKEKVNRLNANVVEAAVVHE